MTSKRQATFPKETCEALGLKPGDNVELEPRIMAGKKVWVLRPQSRRERNWVGCLGGKVRPVDDHSLAAVRASIVKGRKTEE